MNFPIKFHHKVASTLFRPFAVRQRPSNQLILVLGCMRSGSSLLSNILISNPAILGYGETLTTYRSPPDLNLLQYWIYRFTRQRLGAEQHLFDKVLHHELLSDFRVFDQFIRIRPIFILRSPESAFGSLHEHLNRGDATVQVSETWRYMHRRFAELEDLASTLTPETEAVWLLYDELLREPEPILTALSEFLNLESPLKTKYDVRAFVGRWGLGDGSTKIRTGKIQPPEAPQVIFDVPPEAVSAFKRLVARFESCARKI